MLAPLFALALMLTPTEDRGAALLDQVKHLKPEARAQVIARMEIAVVEASPEAKPALLELLHRIQQIDRQMSKTQPTPETSEPGVSSLQRFQKLSPEQRSQVIARMEQEKEKAAPAEKASLDALLKRLRAMNAPTGPKAAKDRIQACVDRFRQLDDTQRAQVLSQLQGEVLKAPTSQRKVLEGLIERLKTLPPASPQIK